MKAALAGAFIVAALLPASLQAAVFNSVQSGLWNDPNTWGGGTPGAADTVNINHSVTGNVAIAFTQLNVNTGGTMAIGSNLAAVVTSGGGVTLNGGTLISDTGQLQIQAPGGATLQYISGTSRPSTGPDLNTTDLDDITNDLTFGVLEVSGPVRFLGNVAIRNSMTLFPGGSVSTSGGGVAPFYRRTSALVYRGATTFQRGLEWSAPASDPFPTYVSTAPVSYTTTRGFPSVVTVGDGTSATTVQLGNALYQQPRTFGLVTVSATSTLTLNGPTAPDNLTVPLITNGGLTNSGSLVLSSTAGGGLTLRAGDLAFNTNASSITSNGRTVRFDSTLPQSLTSTGGRNTTVTFAGPVDIANTSVGGVTIDVANPAAPGVAVEVNGANLSVLENSTLTTTRRVRVFGGNLVNAGNFNASNTTTTIRGTSSANGQLQNTGTVSAVNHTTIFDGTHGAVTNNVALSSIQIGATANNVPQGIFINTAFTISGSTLLVLRNNLVNNSNSFTANSSTVSFSGSTNQNITNNSLTNLTLQNLTVGTQTVLIQTVDRNNILRGGSLTLNGTIRMARNLALTGDDPDGAGPDVANGTFYNFGLTGSVLDFGEANNGTPGTKGDLASGLPFVIERTNDPLVPTTQEYFELYPNATLDNTDPTDTFYTSGSYSGARAQITLPQRTALSAPGIFQYLQPGFGPTVPPGPNNNNIVNGAWTTRGPGLIVTLDNQTDLETARVVQDPGGVLAVDLLDFSASVSDEGIVTLTWTTAAEYDNAGFHVYGAKGASFGALGDRITTTIIPAEGSETTGFTYTFQDPSPLAQGEVRGYFLEDVDLSGKQTQHGPVTIGLKAQTPAQATAILNTLTTDVWESIAPTTIYDAPVFTGGDGEFLGLGVSGDAPNAVFGLWQTRNALEALPPGVYRLSADVSYDKPLEKLAPTLRLRAFTQYHLLSSMLESADTANRGTRALPGTVSTIFESDGETPWYVALDLISFDDEQAGALRISNVRVTPIQ